MSIDIYPDGHQKPMGASQGPGVTPPVVPPDDIDGFVAWYDSDASRVTEAAGLVSALVEVAAVSALVPMVGPVGAQPFWSATAGSMAVPGIRYNASTARRLMSGDSVIAAALSATTLQPNTYVVVGEYISTASPNVLCSIRNIPQGRFCQWSFTGVASKAPRFSRSNGGASGSADSLPTTTAVGVPFLLVTRFSKAGDGLTVKFTLNGVSYTTTLTTTPPGKVMGACLDTVLGNIELVGSYSNGFNGWLYQHVFYDAYLSDNDVKELRRYYRSVYPLLP